MVQDLPFRRTDLYDIVDDLEAWSDQHYSKSRIRDILRYFATSGVVDQVQSRQSRSQDLFVLKSKYRLTPDHTRPLAQCLVPLLDASIQFEDV